jgi:hypothetical protein
MFEAVIGPPARAEDRAEAERIAAYYARLGTLRAAFMMRKLFAEELRNTSYLDTLDRVTKANLTSNGPYHWTCVFRPDDPDRPAPPGRLRPPVPPPFFRLFGPQVFGDRQCLADPPLAIRCRAAA